MARGQIVSSTKVYAVNLAKSLRSQSAKVIANRLKSSAKSIENKGKKAIQKEIDHAVRRNVIFSRLMHGSQKGVQGYDLQAEFGLSNAEAQIGCKKIIEHLKATVGMPNRGFKVIDKNLPKFSIKFTYLQIQKYRESILSDTSLQYMSQQKHLSQNRKVVKVRKAQMYTIKWAKWLIEAYRGMNTIGEDLGESIKRYGIIYDLQGGQKLFSRSGRALMGMIRFGTLAKKGFVKSNIGTDKRSFSQGAEAVTEGDVLDQIILREEQELAGIKDEEIKGVKGFIAPKRYQYPEGARPDGGEANFIEEMKNGKLLPKQIDDALRKIIKDAIAKRKR